MIWGREQCGVEEAVGVRPDEGGGRAAAERPWGRLGRVSLREHEGLFEVPAHLLVFAIHRCHIRIREDGVDLPVRVGETPRLGRPRPRRRVPHPQNLVVDHIREIHVVAQLSRPQVVQHRTSGLPRRAGAAGILDVLLRETVGLLPLPLLPHAARGAAVLREAGDGRRARLVGWRTAREHTPTAWWHGGQRHVQWRQLLVARGRAARHGPWWWMGIVLHVVVSISIAIALFAKPRRHGGAV
mmetsp:Transcript_53526/g.134738  ORF Transcript_53526/g.134738 Transcript_53526/m.134738 type:complete len:241 (-) Transcript_53526:82-804(-)